MHLFLVASLLQLVRHLLLLVRHLLLLVRVFRLQKSVMKSSEVHTLGDRRVTKEKVDDVQLRNNGDVFCSLDSIGSTLPSLLGGGKEDRAERSKCKKINLTKSHIWVESGSLRWKCGLQVAGQSISILWEIRFVAVVCFPGQSLGLDPSKNLKVLVVWTFFFDPTLTLSQEALP